MHYLLDACALLVICNGEPEAQKVLDLFKQAKTGSIRLSLSIIQLLEVYYDRIYIAGEEEARTIIESILAEPITIIEHISYPVMFEAGRFKTSYSMSIADAIAAGISKNLGTTLVTKDEEFKMAEKDGELSLLWLK